MRAKLRASSHKRARPVTGYYFRNEHHCEDRGLILWPGLERAASAKLPEIHQTDGAHIQG
jgi:hypothetical protein